MPQSEEQNIHPQEMTSNYTENPMHIPDDFVTEVESEPINQENGERYDDVDLSNSENGMQNEFFYNEDPIEYVELPEVEEDIAIDDVSSVTVLLLSKLTSR